MVSSALDPIERNTGGEAGKRGTRFLHAECRVKVRGDQSLESCKSTKIHHQNPALSIDMLNFVHSCSKGAWSLKCNPPIRRAPSPPSPSHPV